MHCKAYKRQSNQAMVGYYHLNVPFAMCISDPRPLYTRMSGAIIMFKVKNIVTNQIRKKMGRWNNTDIIGQQQFGFDVT